MCYPIRRFLIYTYLNDICRLDESLLISSTPTISTVQDDTLVDLGSLESYPRHMSFSDGPSKTPSPNPTFITSMEHSKFSSLTRQQNDDK